MFKRRGVYLFAAALLTGVTAGLVVTAFRFGISHAALLVRLLLNGTQGDAARTALWFADAVVFGLCAAVCYKIEPLISGSGIPQVQAQLTGQVSPNWRKVLTYKFVGGLVTLGGGLTLGREGPSVQLGAMAGQGVFELTSRNCPVHDSAPDTTKPCLLVAGAAAGLSAAFNAPLAGVVFAFEELHKKFSGEAMLTAAVASITAALVAGMSIEAGPVLSFGLELHPETLYPVPLLPTHLLVDWTHLALMIAVGLVTGLSGVLFNHVILLSKAIYKHLKLHWALLGIIPFVVTAVACYFNPHLFASGEPLIFIHGLDLPELAPMQELLRLTGFYLAKLLLLALAFGSGLPGGIFFPMLVLGSLVGNIFVQAGALTGALVPTPGIIVLLPMLAMAGHFAAIVRSPLTGVILIAEMTGAFPYLLPLGITAFTAYLVAEACHSEPIYDSLKNLMLNIKN